MTIHEKLDIIMRGGVTAGDLINTNSFWTITTNSNGNEYMKIMSDHIVVGHNQTADTWAAKSVDLTPYNTLEITILSAYANNEYYGADVSVDGVNITGAIGSTVVNKTYTYDISTINKEAVITLHAKSGGIRISNIKLY